MSPLQQDTRHASVPRRRIAVVGSGIAGLSCAWALSTSHDVTLYERDSRLGGHANTLDVEGPGGAPLAVDTGFVVYNVPAYPNLDALLDHLGVETRPTDMSFAVSLDRGRLEYSGTDLPGLFAQPRNLLRPRFWRMLADLLRFYRLAPPALDTLDETTTLGDWLDRNRFSTALQDDHLLPMAAAIWSCPTGQVRDYPARAFIRFCVNHGLLQVSGRPVWRTIVGGSRVTVGLLRDAIARTGTVLTGHAIVAVRPTPDGVVLTDQAGTRTAFDAVVLACHAPDALALLPDAPARTREALAAFRTTANRAVLHRDPALMPGRRRAWSSWNLIGSGGRQTGAPCVTYWMNRLQGLPGRQEVFVSLNPVREPDPATVLHTEQYAHPMFDATAQAAQRAVWAVQGIDGLWFAGAWLGAGFHEDGLQAGLAVAEALGGVRRPWSVENENGRMPGPPLAAPLVRSRAA